MKPLFLAILIGFSPFVSLAQQPNRGFERKQKTTTPSVNVAERLGAQVIDVPKNKAGRQTLMKSGSGSAALDPLRLRVIRDADSGLPIFIERKQTSTTATSSTGKARLSANAAAGVTYQFMNQVRSLLQIENPSQSFKVNRTETDELGQLHVRMQQTYNGVQVFGTELVAHLTDGDVTSLNGRYKTMPNGLPVTPRLSLSQASERAFEEVRKTSKVRSFGDNILKMKSTEGEMGIFPTDDGQLKLAYQVTVRPNLLERWEYVIDAQTGDVLDKYNHTCTLMAPPVTASAKDLNGVTRTLQTYQQSGTYYMIDASRPMFNATTSKMPNDPVGAIWTVDARNSKSEDPSIYQITSTNNTNWTPTAVSAHYNAGVAYSYYKNTFNRNALSGNGSTIISLINILDDDGKGLDNAYWNGKIMAYGNGRLLKPLAGGLDVAGHEMTHGVIQNTANLQYKGQSGAINESMADVFGVLIDRDDWTVGEDIATPSVLPSGALRSMSNPNQGGKAKDPNGYQPATMAQYETTTEDNGGVHINSGIPNFAFYKFATAVGKDKAEKVYYRALTTYLVRTSQFLDLRLAIVKAAGDLYGASGTEVAAAKKAFDDVGITESTQSTPGKQPDLPVASGQDLLLLSDASDSKLYSTVIGVSPAKFDLKSSLGLRHRPSVTDDGKYAYYVTTDKKIRAVNLSGTPSETIISDETIWDNVAVSRDGTKLAALTADRDGSIYVYSYALKKWAEFKLYNPTYTTGVSTGDVKYADSFEWDFNGENIVYDAYNELRNNSGEAVDYWDVGFLNVWSNASGNFAKGDIEKLFANLDEGESIGNPSYSKNSPDVIAFDYLNETDDTYYIVAVDLSAGSLKGVYKNNTLGFPSYSRQDDKLVFSTESNSSEAISAINLASDKISPSGNVSVIYTGGKWPVWYTQATRQTKTAQTITFNAIADRYVSQGDLTLSATSSSNLPVSFLVRSGAATLSGNVLKFSNTGAVTVRAYQDGNTQFAAATSVDRTFQVLVVTDVAPLWSEAVKLFPNPVKTTLVVELPATETIENVALRTLTGATVLQPVIGTRQRSVTLEVGHLSEGFYILQVQTPKGTASWKIVKE